MRKRVKIKLFYINSVWAHTGPESPFIIIVIGRVVILLLRTKGLIIKVAAVLAINIYRPIMF